MQSQSSYPDDTMTNLKYTYQLDKISCIKEMWYIHITLAYTVIASGVCCLSTRIIYKWSHVYFGRLYIISMLWCMATSLVIHNTGLPIAVLISFLWVLGGLTVGWFVIKIHQNNMENSVSRLMSIELTSESKEQVLDKIKLKGLKPVMLDYKHKIAHDKSWIMKLYSFKALHGALMFTSFINVFGRVFGTNYSHEFTCHTYPYYKQVNSPKFNGLETTLTPVPIHDIDYEKLPWAFGKQGDFGLYMWGLIFSMGPIIFSFLIGGVIAWYNIETPGQKNNTAKNTMAAMFNNIRLDKRTSL